jgi:predicted HicB family RNase H-like nuclease
MPVACLMETQHPRRDAQLNVRVEPSLREQLEQLAARDDRTVSDWARRALREAARRAEVKAA